MKQRLNPVGVYKIGDTEVYEDNNWDLSERFNCRDWELYEKKEIGNPTPNRDKNGKIPVNIGCGVRVKDGSGDFIYTDNSVPAGESREVELVISSWIGVSPGAMHYYGNLRFKAAETHPEGHPDTWTSCWDIPLLSSHDIQLTRILEAWEIKKFRDAYDGWYVGDNYSGFYSPDAVIKRGKEVFFDFFGRGWKLKINHRY